MDHFRCYVTRAEVRLLFCKSGLGGQQLQLNVLRQWRNPYGILLFHMRKVKPNNSAKSLLSAGGCCTAV